MKKAGVKALRRNEWEIGELKEGKVYMPKNKKLRLEVIQLHHDMLVAKYRDRWKIRAILEILYKVWTERLARVASNSRVYSKQQSLFSNKDIVFHIKIWQKVENRGRYQKKRKVKKTTKFVKIIRNFQEKAKATLRKVQEKMKQQANKERKEAEV